MSEPRDEAQQQALLRESANRARRLAGSMIVAEDRERLIAYAEELEQQALELGKPGALDGITPRVEQVQVQQQQQHESGPPVDPGAKTAKD